MRPTPNARHRAAFEIAVYYNDQSAFEAAQSERRVRMLWDYLGKLDPKEREEALEDCRQDLADLGLPF